MKIKEEELIEARHKIGLYSVAEICSMFSCGRAVLDYLINSGKLDYISPNGRARFVRLEDYLIAIKKIGGAK